MQIEKTRITRPPLMLVYGDHKIGKSTFAAGCPKAVFVPTEGGLENLGVDAFPVATHYHDFLRNLNEILKEKHDYKTLVIDSLDWAERLMWQHLCELEGWKQIGDGSYGAGYKLALGRWSEFLDLIRRINSERKMLVVLIAHAKISKFEDPERDNYDRYDLDLHDKSGNLICQAMDIIGFASSKVVTQTKKEGLKTSVKAKIVDERVLNLNKAAAYEAGNRYGLPAQIPLEWSALAAALKEAMKKPEKGNLADVAEEKKVKDLSKIGE